MSCLQRYIKYEEKKCFCLKKTASIGEKTSTHWKGCFQWAERMLPDFGSNASDGWKLWGGLFCQEGIGKRLELLDGVGLDG